MSKKNFLDPLDISTRIAVIINCGTQAMTMLEFNDFVQQVINRDGDFNTGMPEDMVFVVYERGFKYLMWRITK